MGGTASAATYDWVGPAGVPSPWETPSNWSGGAAGTLPGSGDDAFINDGGVATLSSDQSVNIVAVGATAAGGESGTLTHTGGTLTVGDDAFVGGQYNSVANPPAILGTGTGTYNLSGGSVTTEFDFYVGAAGQGTLNLSSGTLTAKRYVRIGETPGSVGSVVQSGGVVNGTLLMGGVGTSNTASYTMNGGTFNAADMFVGWKGTGAVFTMNDGVINGATHLRVGEDNGSGGTFNMNGGTATFPAFMLIGHFAPAGSTTPTVGRLNITGGTISGRNFNVGQHPQAQGIVTQTGGTSNATANLVIGEISRRDNLYNISGGVLNVKNTGPTEGNGSAYVGSGDGIGELRVSGTADVNIDSNLTFGGGANSVGTFNMTGGSVEQLGVDADGISFTYFGANGKGFGNISGGALTTNWIILGNQANTTSEGQVTQTAGDVHAKTSMTVGNLSPQNNFYAISGGTLDVDANLRVARFSSNTTSVVPSAGRLTIDGTASVNVDGQLVGSEGWTPTTGDNANIPLPGGNALIEMKNGTLTAGSFVNGAAVNPSFGVTSSYVQTGGTATLGHVTGTGSMSVAGGTLNVNSMKQATATVSGGTVQVAADPTAAGTSVINNLAITGTGKLDLTKNKLVTNTPVGTAGAVVGNTRTYSGLQGMVQRAKNGDAWDGNGLTSSVVATEGGLTTIGIANGAQAKGGIGATETALWGGETITGSSILAMYTYAGDANLDGAITGDDYSAIDFGILFEGMDGYANGDFNYDGYVTGDDYSVIDLNILLQGPQIPTGGSVAAGSDLAGVTAVPEPASFGVLAMAGIGLLARRSRRRR